MHFALRRRALAEFIRIEGNLPPEGADVFDFQGAGGARLRGAFFPRDGARATFILLTGWAEFIEKYFEVVRDLHARGFAVAMMDWRSQGLSERFGGNLAISHLDDFGRFRADLVAFSDRVAASDLPAPAYLMTHSMGGAPALQTLADGDTRFRAAILCAPLTALPAPQPAAAVYSAVAGLAGALGLGARGLPGRFNEIGPFDARALTSDEARHNRFRALQEAKPRAAVRAPSFGWLQAALAAMRDLHRPDRFKALKTPVLIISAGRDRMVSSDDHAILAARSPLIDRILIDDARHEILMERDALRGRYWAAVDRFLAEKAPPPQAESAEKTASA